MDSKLKVKISKYMSYLLRHNPENLEMDRRGFVDLGEFLLKLREKHDVDKVFVIELVSKGDRKRFEIVGGKIRALYGHSIGVKVELEEDKSIDVLFHGTTSEAAFEILRKGIKPMKRQWVHLSPTKENAIEVGRRRTSDPAVLEVNAREARRSGLRFFKATERVYVCSEVPSEYIRLLPPEWLK